MKIDVDVLKASGSKPWEETWATWEVNGRVAGIETSPRDSNGDSTGLLMVQPAMPHDVPGLAERIRVASAAPEMARLLIALERDGRIDRFDERICVECGQNYEERERAPGEGRHLPDCALVAALRKAGVIV